MRSFLKVAALANTLALLLFFVRYRIEEVRSRKKASPPHKHLTQLHQRPHPTLEEVLPEVSELAALENQGPIGAETFPEYSIGEMLTQTNPEQEPQRELLMSGSKADAHMFTPLEAKEEESSESTQFIADPSDLVENYSSNKACGHGNFGKRLIQRKAAVKNK